MKVELLVMGDSEPCVRAEAVWRAACAERDAELRILDVASHPGAGRFRDLGLVGLPAVIINGNLVAMGVQDGDEARQLLDPL